MTNTKKELQKVIKEIRDSAGYGDFPKAMATKKQMEKKQATIACSPSYFDSDSNKVAEIVIANKSFQEFLKKHNATATKEEFLSIDMCRKHEAITRIRIQF